MENSVQNLNDQPVQPSQMYVSPVQPEDKPNPQTQQKPKATGFLKTGGFKLLLLMVLVILIVLIIGFSYFQSLNKQTSSKPNRAVKSKINNAQLPTTISKPQQSVTPYILIPTEDSPNKILQYQDYASNHIVQGPYYSTASASWVADGLFGGYGNNIVLLISPVGARVFNLNGSTVVREITAINPQSTGSATTQTDLPSAPAEFAKDIPFGKYLRVYYNPDKSTVDGSAVKIEYLASYKF